MSKKYTKTHEWIESTETKNQYKLGISNYAQNELGDVVLVELPDVGASFDAGAEIATIESVKAASSIYTPIAGRIVAINDALEDAPERVNESAEDEGWLVIMESDADVSSSLISSEEYEKLLVDLQ